MAAQVCFPDPKVSDSPMDFEVFPWLPRWSFPASKSSGDYIPKYFYAQVGFPSLQVTRYSYRSPGIPIDSYVFPRHSYRFLRIPMAAQVGAGEVFLWLGEVYG